jgi:hypothetical protein
LTIAETLNDKAAVSGCADVGEERRKGWVGDEPDVVLHLVGEVKDESHALDAAELGGGNGVDPVLDEGESADLEEHCEVLESVVHETRFGAELSVDLDKAWLLGPGELGDVALGRGRQDELEDDAIIRRCNTTQRSNMVVTLSALTKIYICDSLARCKQSDQPFATPERITDEVDPAYLQAVIAKPGEQSDDVSLSNDSLFIPQTAGRIHRP